MAKLNGLWKEKEEDEHIFLHCVQNARLEKNGTVKAEGIPIRGSSGRLSYDDIWMTVYKGHAVRNQLAGLNLKSPFLLPSS